MMVNGDRLSYRSIGKWYLHLAALGLEVVEDTQLDTMSSSSPKDSPSRMVRCAMGSLECTIVFCKQAQSKMTLATYTR
jgi:hypothetical protein